MCITTENKKDQSLVAWMSITGNIRTFRGEVTDLALTLLSLLCSFT